MKVSCRDMPHDARSSRPIRLWVLGYLFAPESRWREKSHFGRELRFTYGLDRLARNDRVVGVDRSIHSVYGCVELVLGAGPSAQGIHRMTPIGEPTRECDDLPKVHQFSHGSLHFLSWRITFLSLFSRTVSSLSNKQHHDLR